MTHVTAEKRGRGLSKRSDELYSLRYYCGPAMVLKITAAQELRDHCRGPNGREMANAPKGPQEEEERLCLFLHYLRTRQVQECHICRIDMAVYVKIPLDERMRKQIAQQANRQLGLNCYREPIARLPEEEAVA